MKKWIVIIDNLLKTNYGEVLVNLTELCLIMNEEGSDKGNGHHNYSKIYHELFKDIREHPINIFELGVGSNNPYINSNMGLNGKPGASLRGWSKYFALAKVYGADIDGNIVNGRYDTDRIKTVWVDQRSPSTIKTMWDKFSDVKFFDIMIDDGLHEVRANMTFLENSHHKLSEGGIYIIEDILPHEIKIFEEKLSTFCQSNKFEYRFLDIPECQNKADNKLIILSRI
jgi:hypothetical protein